MLYLSNKHMNKNLPTLVSYQGGSAGDLFTASLNQLCLKFQQNRTVQIPNYSIKNSQVRSVSDIHGLVRNLTCQYVSTHEFDLLLGSDLAWINVIVEDPEIQDICVLRQMYLQILRIKVDQSSDWYRIVKSLCLRNKPESAARYWLEQARRLWINDMQKRIAHRHMATTTVNFDQLFHSQFSQDIKQQGFECVVLDENHAAWLEKNPRHFWNEESTVKSMAQKLSAMNWSQTTGVVSYSA